MPKGGSIVHVQTTSAERAKNKQQNKAGDIVAYLLPRAKRATDIKTQTNKNKQHTIMVLFEPSYGLDCA